MRNIFGFTISVVAAVLLSSSVGFAASPNSSPTAVTVADGQNAITLVVADTTNSQLQNTGFRTLSTPGSVSSLYTVATGKRLVVETISALVQVPSPETLASVTIRSGPDPGTGDKETIHYLHVGPAQPYTDSGGASYNLYTIDVRQAHIYASAGDSLSFLVTRSTNPGFPGTSVRYNATLTGFLIPCTASSANTCP